MKHAIIKYIHSRKIVRQRGFTILEILLVLGILGVLCWVVIPEMTAAAGDDDHQETALENALLSLRSRLELYKAEHLNQYPCGNPSNPDSPSDFANRLLTITNADHSSKGIFGPYLTRFPANVFNGLNDVRYGNDPGKNLAGWCFDPVSGHIYADDGQASPDGTLHCRY